MGAKPGARRGLAPASESVGQTEQWGARCARSCPLWRGPARRPGRQARYRRRGGRPAPWAHAWVLKCRQRRRARCRWCPRSLMQRPRVHTDRDKCLWTALKGVLDLTAGAGRGGGLKGGHGRWRRNGPEHPRPRLARAGFSAQSEIMPHPTCVCCVLCACAVFDGCARTCVHVFPVGHKLSGFHCSKNKPCLKISCVK